MSKEKDQQEFCSESPTPADSSDMYGLTDTSSLDEILQSREKNTMTNISQNKKISSVFFSFLRLQKYHEKVSTHTKTFLHQRKHEAQASTVFF